MNLEERRHGLGGSDAAVALGLSPWRSPLDLYLGKRSEPSPDDPDREREPLRWGKLLEPVIRSEYARRTGYTVEVPDKIRHPKYEWMFAHVDGIASGKRVLECKNASSAAGWGEPGTDEIPRHYLIQVQHYLAVTTLAVADVAVLIGGSDFRTYEIPADAELQELIIEGEAVFWQRVQRGDPPPLDLANTGRALQTLRRMFPGTDGSNVIADESDHTWLNVYRHAAECRSQYEKMEQLAKAHLLRQMGNAATMGFHQAGLIATRKVVNRKAMTVPACSYVDFRIKETQ